MKRPLLLVSLLFAACGGSPPEPELALSIQAAPDTLESENGTTPAAVLRAFLLEDGVPRRITPTRWTVADPRFGSVDSEGRFIASGTHAGVVRVAAALDLEGQTLTAETEITVRVRRDVVVTPGLSPSIVQSFETATPVNDPRTAPYVLYPLEGAHVPNDLAAPEIQWDDSWDSEGRQDPIRVTLESPYARVHAYLDGAQIHAAWTVDDESWALIAQASAGEEVAVEVARLNVTGGIYAPSQRVRFSMSSRPVHLAMLAWELLADPQRSGLVDLDLSEGARQEVDLGQVECVGCHTVAVENDRFAANVDRFFTGIYDGDGTELARIEPPLEGVAFQPGGSLLIGSRTAEDVSALFAFDRSTGEPVAVGSLPTDAGFAAWSPDGSRLAYVVGGSDHPAGTSGPTSIAVVEHQGDAFGAPTVLHDGSALSEEPEGGATDSHPTYSPDGEWIAFAHGTWSQATLEGTPARSAIYLMPAAGGDAVRLDAAMGPEGDLSAFWPVFAPRTTIEEDGTRLFWLAYYSRMPYGNPVAGTRDKSHRQLWVAAIDPARTEGDPSFAPFHVPAQRIDREQLGAAWRPLSCRAEEAECRVDSQCCSGWCVDGACGPPFACRPRGASCDEASPCCGELVCEASQCVEVIE